MNHCIIFFLRIVNLCFKNSRIMNDNDTEERSPKYMHELITSDPRECTKSILKITNH